jgi:hypothetical protein
LPLIEIEVCQVQRFCIVIPFPNSRLVQLNISATDLTTMTYCPLVFVLAEPNNGSQPTGK